MKILLYNPDNGVTRNFMPHLWMFLLQALTPHGHEVVLIDGNAQPMDEEGIARYVREENIGLVGIGAMTRMIAKAYRVADAVRAAGVKVVMGGPHVTEMAGEALGQDGGSRHADAVALGEADETWPRIVEDAARSTLKDVYAPVDDFGQERKPSLKPYSEIPSDKIKLDQFNLLPGILHPLLKRVGAGWGTFRIIPVESGRGCPYGCEFWMNCRYSYPIRVTSGLPVIREESPQWATPTSQKHFASDAIRIKKSKTLAGIRAVPMSSRCKAELLRWRGQLGPEFSEYVFATTNIQIFLIGTIAFTGAGCPRRSVGQS